MSHTLMFELHDKVPIKQVGAFFVPQNCSGISFTHTIDTPYSMLVILMIRDNHGRLRFQKQLGHSSKTVYLGETAEYTTIGGIPGKINSGQWTLEFIFNQNMENISTEAIFIPVLKFSFLRVEMRRR